MELGALLSLSQNPVSLGFGPQPAETLHRAEDGSGSRGLIAEAALSKTADTAVDASLPSSSRTTQMPDHAAKHLPQEGN